MPLYSLPLLHQQLSPHFLQNSLIAPNEPHRRVKCNLHAENDRFPMFHSFSCSAFSLEPLLNTSLHYSGDKANKSFQVQTGKRIEGYPARIPYVWEKTLLEAARNNCCWGPNLPHHTNDITNFFIFSGWNSKCKVEFSSLNWSEFKSTTNYPILNHGFEGINLPMLTENEIIEDNQSTQH